MYMVVFTLRPKLVFAKWNSALVTQKLIHCLPKFCRSEVKQ